MVGNDTIEARTWAPAPDLDTAIRAFTAAAQDGNDESTVLHAFQILEFVNPLCERARAAEARVARLESFVEEIRDWSAADGDLATCILAAFQRFDAPVEDPRRRHCPPGDQCLACDRLGYHIEAPPTGGTDHG